MGPETLPWGIQDVTWQAEEYESFAAVCLMG